MATNDFQVFAGASGANVITQAQYAALPNLTTGFQSGLAQSNQMNKVLRQTTIMASMIGQFIADQSNQNATDDGTTGTLEQRFIAALRNLFRTKLTANLNLYVNAGSGNDSNNGLSTTTAFRTIQAAIQTVYAKYDLSGFGVNINLADGTYTAASGTGVIGVNGAPTGATASGGNIAIIGNIAAPQNVIISAVNAHAVAAGVNAWISIAGVTFTATGSGGVGGFAIVGFPNGTITINGPCIFGACGSGHLTAVSGSVIVNNGVNYTVNGNAPTHLSASSSGSINFVGNNAVTISGNPTFSSAFAAVSSNANISMPATTISFTGTVTGQRYSAQMNGTITTGTGNVNFFPGTVAGAVGSGGQYG